MRRSNNTTGREIIHTLLVVGLSLSLSTSNVFAQALTQTRTGPSANLENLNDADKKLSESYVHDGLSQRTYLEQCGASDELKRACQGMDVDPKIVGIRASMIQAMSKAYTMVIGAGGGGGLEMNKPEAGANATGGENTAAGGDAPGGTDAANSGSKEKQDNTDYCKYVAAGTEAIALVQQQVAQQNLNSIPANGDTAQKELLYKAARSHGERAQQSKIQFGGWGATTVCYGAMMARPAVSKSAWQNWLKLGASGLMTAFYHKLYTEHEKYEKKVKEIADMLPGKGDCNPITEKHCYCAQPETKFDPTHCAAQIHKKKIAENSYRVACLDENLKTDTACKCAETDTCYDKVLSSQIDAMGLNNYIKAGVAPFQSMAKGELKGGTLNTGSTSQSAMARRALEQAAPHLPRSTVSLTEAQKEDAKEMQAMGLPAAMAAQLAGLPMTAEAQKNMSRFENGDVPMGNVPTFSGFNTGSKNNVINYGGASGMNNRRTASSNNSNPFNKLQKGQGSGRSGETINYGSYAEKAQKTAEINKGDNRLIFEIISRRYQVSGWKRLDIE
jgi:hypothetical protein